MQNTDPSEGTSQQQENSQQVQAPKEREVEIINTSQWEKKSEDNGSTEKR